MNAVVENPKRDLPAESGMRHSVVFGTTAAAVYGLALVKAIVVTGAYGTGPEMDAFTMAFLIPNLLASIAAGNCAPAMVPALAWAAREGPVARAQAFRATLWISLLASVVAAAILHAFAGPMIQLIAPGFDAVRHTRAAELLRVLSFMPMASIVFGYCSAELLSRRKYFSVAAAPAISTAITVAVIVGFPHSITALAYGVLAGTLVQAAIMLRLSLPANPAAGRLRLWTPHTRGIVLAQLPLMGAAVFGVANSGIDQFFASLLPTGSASALNYANSLQSWLVQSLVMAASWVALPEFSKLASSGELPKMRDRARQYIVALSALAAPLTAAVLLFGGAAVQAVFERRAFTAHSTELVGSGWMGYTLGIVPLAIGMVCVRILNATSANRALIIVGAVMLPLNAVLDFILMRIFGIYGIGLSTSLVYYGSAVLLLYLAGRRIGNLVDGATARALLCAVVASSIGGAACLGTRRLVASNGAGLLISAAVLVLTIAALYAMAGLLEPLSTRLLHLIGVRRLGEKPNLLA